MAWRQAITALKSSARLYKQFTNGETDEMFKLVKKYPNDWSYIASLRGRSSNLVVAAATIIIVVAIAKAGIDWNMVREKLPYQGHRISEIKAPWGETASPSKSSGRFTLVSQYGTEDWNLIAKNMES
ncbi:hypothetical protein BDB00DRAFT_930782 [Zychaea mexicana]|uniref:uncharacterized protein n=1 Tax=Zychaea mexicana TaxID=64656 RepID=UPI0022FF1E2D|nr:uncharacterized protein BDB00DRAFT_930782 [Zychaea mexicana]KAI9491080.1 hypothetical protein BDB00DRAFT_930782 [Zychaea mexicana]